MQGDIRLCVGGDVKIIANGLLGQVYRIAVKRASDGDRRLPHADDILGRRSPIKMIHINSAPMSRLLYATCSSSTPPCDCSWVSLLLLIHDYVVTDDR